MGMMELPVVELQKASLIVGYNQGGAVMVPHYTTANKKLAMLGVPGQFLVIQSKSLVDGTITTTEIRLDRYYGIEFVPLVESPPEQPAVSVLHKQ